MIKHQTVGDLRAALAGFPDDVTVRVVLEGRCVASDGIAVLGLHDDRLVLDGDGDDSPLIPRGRKRQLSMGMPTK